MNKHLFIVLDTETANGGEDLIDSQVYDCGYQVIDLHGNIYERKSFIVRETFYDKEMMSSAYYAEKIPRYWKDIWNKTRKVIPLEQLKQELAHDCAKYQVKAIIAHNAAFDRRALNKTIRYCTCSKERWFAPYGIEWWDTLKMARDIYGNMPTYRKFCEENGYMTKHSVPRPRLTAEVIYRFITKNTEFEESHMGLEDVEIESQIFWNCVRKHKKMRRTLD